MDTGCEGESGMNDKILDELQLYLTGDIDIDSLEDRIIPLAWESEFEDQELLDQIAFELIYVKDGLSDESVFRARMVEIVVSKQAMTIDINGNTGESQVVWRVGNHNSNTQITYREPVAPIDYQFKVQFDLPPAVGTQLS